MRIIPVLICLATFFSGLGQSFGEVGSKWYYKSQSNYGATHGTFICEVTKKVSFQGKICSELKRYDYNSATSVACNYFSRYIYEEDSSVYFWDKDFQKFSLLYDFKAKPASGWVINYRDPWPANDSVVVYVDSVGYELFGNDSLKVLYVSWSSSFGSKVKDKIVYELGLLSYLFPMSARNCSQDWAGGLVCFESPTLGYYKSGLRPNCLFSNLSVSEENVEYPLYIYPNPARNYLHITTSLPVWEKYMVYKTSSISGQNSIQGEVLSSRSIDVSMLPQGIYFIELRNQSRTFPTQRFIKE